MAKPSNEEIGQRLHSSGYLEQFEQAVAADNPMLVVSILQEVGVSNETAQALERIGHALEQRRPGDQVDVFLVVEVADGAHLRARGVVDPATRSAASMSEVSTTTRSGGSPLRSISSRIASTRSLLWEAWSAY